MRVYVSILIIMALAGCGPIRLPRLPKPIAKPETAVTGVRLVETGANAARYDIDVALYNPNDEPLPLTFVEYRFEVEGRRYETDGLPRTTLPASGRVTVTLPAIVTGDQSPPDSGGYRTSGRITITPEGEVRRLLYTMGWPKPKTSFEGAGPIGPPAEKP